LEGEELTQKGEAYFFHCEVVRVHNNEEKILLATLKEFETKEEAMSFWSKLSRLLVEGG